MEQRGERHKPKHFVLENGFTLMVFLRQTQSAVFESKARLSPTPTSTK